jgi:hypothetical protein
MAKIPIGRQCGWNKWSPWVLERVKTVSEFVGNLSPNALACSLVFMLNELPGTPSGHWKFMIQ